METPPAVGTDFDVLRYSDHLKNGVGPGFNISSKLLLDRFVASLGSRRKDLNKIVDPVITKGIDIVLSKDNDEPTRQAMLFNTLFGEILDLACVPNDKRAYGLRVLLKLTSQATLDAFKGDAGDIFWHTIASELVKPAKGELGREFMTSTGGVHLDSLDVTRSPDSNGDILLVGLKTSLIGFLQNQVLFGNLNRGQIATLNGEIEELSSDLGITGIGTESMTHNSHVKYYPGKGLVTDNPNYLDNWREKIKVRVFNKQGDKFVDLGVGEILNLSGDGVLNLINNLQLQGIELKGRKSSEIDSVDESYNWPIFALSMTDNFPDEYSETYKYRGSRGRNFMYLNVLDIKGNGRLLEFYKGHLRADGFFAKTISDTTYEILSKRFVGEEKFKFPSLIVYPDLRPITPENNDISRLRLSDFVLISEINPDIFRQIEEINKKHIYVDNDKINKFTDSKVVRDLLNSKLTIHMFLAVLETNSAMFAALPILDIRKRLSLGLSASLPDKLTNKLDSVLSRGRDLGNLTLTKEDYGDFMLALNKTRSQQSLAKLGLSAIGFIRAMTLSSEKVTRFVTKVLYKKLADKVNTLQMISNLGTGRASLFVSSLNHDQDGMAIATGIENSTITWRVNLNEKLFSSLDLTSNLDERMLEKLFSDKQSLRKEMVEIYRTWKEIRKGSRNNLNALSRFMDIVKFVGNEDKDEGQKMLELFRFCVIAKVNERMQKTLKLADMVSKGLTTQPEE